MKAANLVCWLALAIYAVASPAAAQQNQNTRQDAKSFGTQNQGTVTNSLSGPITPSTVPGFGGTDLQEKQFIDGNMDDAAEAEYYNDEAAQLLKNGFQNRPKVPIAKNDAWLTGYWDVERDPRSVVEGFTGTYDGCVMTPGGTAAPGTEIVACDEWTTLEQKACTRHVEVDTDQDFKYRCNETSTTRPEYCRVDRDIAVDPDPIYKCERSSDKAIGTCFTERAVTVDQDKVYDCTVSSDRSPGKCFSERTVTVDQDQKYACRRASANAPSNCSLGRSIDVAKSFNYECHQQRSYETKTCDVYFVPSCTAVGQCFGGAISMTWEEWDCNHPQGLKCYYGFAGVTFESGSSQNSISVGAGGCDSMTVSEKWAGDRSSVSVNAQCRHAADGSAPSPGEVQFYNGCCTSVGGSWVDECSNL